MRKLLFQNLDAKIPGMNHNLLFLQIPLTNPILKILGRAAHSVVSRINSYGGIPVNKVTIIHNTKKIIRLSRRITSQTARDLAAMPVYRDVLLP